MSLWDSLFAHLSQPVAQILLTRTDIADRTQYLNAQNTLSELLSMGVIPIVNENDTLAVSEIKFGDNDTLSAITAAMVQADYLFLMTDVDALYNKNPRKFADAVPIEVVTDIDALQADVSSAGSALGTGGMATKIVAARLATSAGTTCIITKSSKPGNVSDIINYLHPPVPAIDPVHITTNGLPSTATPLPPLPAKVPPHTRFLPSLSPIRNRAFWILHGLAAHGTLYIDQGARAALTQKAGLLPVGVLAVEGTFAQQEAVRLVVVDRGQFNDSKRMSSSGILPEKKETKGEEIGRAVVNYSSTEIARILGVRSSEIHGILGYADSDYICLRENVSLIGSEREKGDSNGRNTPTGARTPSKKLPLGQEKGHERVLSASSLNGGEQKSESPRVGGLIDWV
jgi:glutamate 5-kinase